MSRFLALFEHETPPVGTTIYADNRSELFPGVVAESPTLELWPRERSVPPCGSFLLVGVATWSGYDMKLLDEIEAAALHPDVVGVFDMQEAQSPDDFAHRIPGLTDVMQGPVVGLWHDGQLVASGTGHDARSIVFQACHLPIEELADRLDWRHSSTSTQS